MPGWHDRIDLDVFVLSSACQCICGQLGGDGWQGISSAAKRAICATPGEFTACGFVAKWDEYPTLEQDWRLAILARRVTE